MRFTDQHKQHFAATDGAYSDITSADEAKKRQITLTDHEVELFVQHFGEENIHTGAAGTNPELATKQFYFFNENRVIELKLVFPKPKKSELRLYMAKRQGFAPDERHTWFVFKSPNQELLTIGYLETDNWNQLEENDKKTKVIIETIESIDDEDYLYQGEILKQLAKQPIEVSSLRAPRDSKIASQAIAIAKYNCEYDNKHPTFISKATLKPYVECHHLIPMAFQSDFENSLDVPQNIVVLCPNCHRQFHHAEVKVQRGMVEYIFRQRQELLVQAGIEVSLEQLMSYYGIDD
ncbi:HNH endonuclease [Photobacterium rosenbergii]|uniref:HNH endonuclease n=1 Tax=Photobacterium rosenbergii TaxID=294936 RepID=A0ABU3ZLJ4_9GAMM|nr:HNH endonuclease [Photobacterium rosenbergii]MDV5170975.1 HNH endonuclease [Photobacterium rosenbergii]